MFLKKVRVIAGDEWGTHATDDDISDAFEVFLSKIGLQDSYGEMYTEKMKKVREAELKFRGALKKAKIKNVKVDEALQWRIHDFGRRPTKEQMNPIIVAKFGSKFEVLDGAHRIYFAEEQGKLTIKALILDL